MKTLILAVVAGASLVASAQTCTWTGAENGFWTNANNWAEISVPGRIRTPDGIVGDKGDKAVFNGSETGLKNVTIDLDGVDSVGEISVSGGENAPTYVFGTKSSQVIPIEYAGKLQIDGAKTPAPVLVAGFSCGRGYDKAHDWYGSTSSRIVNNSENLMIINDYGFTTVDSESLARCGTALRLEGSGTFRIDGDFKTSWLSAITFFVNCKKVQVNHDISFVMLRADSGSRTEVEILDGKTLTFLGGVNSDGFRVYSPFVISGEGTLSLHKGHDLQIYNANLTISSKIANNSTDPDALQGLRLRWSGDVFRGGVTVTGENGSTGSVLAAYYQSGFKVNKIGRRNEKGNLGIGNKIVLANECAIELLGGDDVSDRTILIQANTIGSLPPAGVVRHNGTGTLRWEGAVAQEVQNATLILDGAATDEAVWASEIAANGVANAVLNLEKRGTGIWCLTAVNSYAGTTAVKDGVLRLCEGGSISASSALVLSGGTFELPDASEASSQGLPAVSVADGVAARIVLGKNRCVTIPSLPTVSGGGTLDIRTYDPTVTLTVTGQSAGAAPAWLTVNGAAATFDANGVLHGPETVWSKASDGDWSEDGNWSNGAPDADKAAYVLESATPRVVTVSTVGATAKTLSLRGVGTELRVGAGKSYVVADGSSAVPPAVGDDIAIATKTFSVSDGATLAVDGGTLSLANLAGLASVSSSNALEPSRIVLTNGASFFYGAQGLRGRFDIGGGGRLEVTDSTVTVDPSSVSSEATLIANGGEIDVRGTSRYQVTRNGDLRVFGSGSTTFDDDSVFVAGTVQQAAVVRIAPGRTGETAEVTFSGRSSISNNIARYVVGGVKGGFAVLNLDSSAYHNRYNAQGTTDLSYYMGVGADYGFGELNVSAGRIDIGSVGFAVGCSRSDVADHESVGVVNMTGGQITILGSASLSHGWAQGRPYGATIGEGTAAANDLERPFTGKMNVSGGTFFVRQGHFLVGLGNARGEFVQTGGTTYLQVGEENAKGSYSSVYGGAKDVIRCATNNASAVGLAGGIGRLVVSNGTFQSIVPMYVGGARAEDVFFTERYADAPGHYATFEDDVYDYPKDRHGADGKLTFCGGTMQLSKSLVLGADGRGELERCGSAGSLTCGGLVLSNNTESVVTFVADENGVGAVNVTGKLSIADGARLVVNVSGTSKKRLLLFDCGEIEGAFDPANVTFVGAPADCEKSIQIVNGKVFYRARKGLALYVR